MNKRLLSVLLILIFVISQTPVFSDEQSITKVTRNETAFDGYLVKYKPEKILKQSTVKVERGTKSNSDSKIESGSESIEQKEDVEQAFKGRLPKASKVEIKDELSEDNTGRKTQLLSIEGEDKETVLKQLREMEGVEYAEPNYKIDRLYDPSFNNQWGLNPSSAYEINIADAWGITYGNSDVVVAVIDTGVDINHPDFAANTYTSTDTIDGVDSDRNGYKDDLHGWDFTTYIDNINNGNNSVYDDPEIDKHGTHVAGIIAAAQNNIGVQGVAPNVKIMPLKVLGEDGGTIFYAIKAIEYANSKGVKIANCSWGFGYYSQFLYDAMNQSDMLFICAAGNDYSDFAECKSYPAAYELDNMISVAAMTSSGSLASFSNYGQGVDIAAPGANIYSTIPNNQYDYMDGTSMAAPFVAGVAALVKSVSPESLASDMKDRILQMVTPCSTLVGKVDTGGYLNASGTVMTLIEPTNMTSPRYGAGYITANGVMYAVGGYDGNSYLDTIAKFDPVTNTWQNVETLPYATAEMSIAAYGDKIYIFSGTNANLLNSVQIYDTKTNEITTGTNMPATIYASACATLGNKAYIFGGLTPNGYSNKVYAYNFTSNLWETKTDLPFSFAYGQAVVSNDVIYILGGVNSNGCLDGIYEYNTTNGSAIFKAQMHSPRKDFGAAVLDGKIYIFGGSISFDAHGKNALLGQGIDAGIFAEAVADTIERYDIYKNICEKVDTLEESVAGIRAVEYFGNIYILGGWYGNYRANVTKYFGTAYPNNIQITPPMNGLVSIMWSKVNGATGYELEIIGRLTTTTTANNFIYTAQWLPSYDIPVRVRSIKDGKYSLWSDISYFSYNDSMLKARSLSFDFSISDKLYKTGQTRWYKVSADQAGTVNLTLSNVPVGCDYVMQFRNSSGEVIATSTSSISNIVVTEYNYYVTVTSINGSSNTNAYTLAGAFTPTVESSVPDRIKAPFLQPSAIDDDISSSSLKNLSEYDGDDDPGETTEESLNEHYAVEGESGSMGTEPMPEEEFDEELEGMSIAAMSMADPTTETGALANQGNVVTKSVTVPANTPSSTSQKLKLVVRVVPQNVDDEFSMEWTSSNTEYNNFRWAWQGEPKEWYLTALLPKSSSSRTFNYKITYAIKSSNSSGNFTIYTYFIVDNTTVEDFNDTTVNDGANISQTITVNSNSPAVFTGKIDHPKDWDFYKVAVSANQKLTAVAESPSGKTYQISILDHTGSSSGITSSQYMDGWYYSEEGISWATIPTGPSTRNYIILVKSDDGTYSSDDTYTLTICRYNVSDLGDLEINNEFSNADSKMSTFTDTYLGTPTKVATPIDFSIDSPMDQDRYAVQMSAGDKISIQMNLPTEYNDSTHQYRIAVCSDVYESSSYVSWLERSYNNPNSARTKSVTFIAEQTATYYVSISSLTRQYHYNMMGTLAITKTPVSYLDSNENKGNECSNDFIFTTIFALFGIQFGVDGWSPITSSVSANFDNELDVDWYKYTNSATSKNALISLSGGESITSGGGLVILDQNYTLLSDGSAGLTYNFAPNVVYYIGAYVKDGQYNSVKNDRNYTLSVTEIPQFSGNVTSIQYNDGEGAKLGKGNKISFALNASGTASNLQYIVELWMGWDSGMLYEKKSNTTDPPKLMYLSNGTNTITFDNIDISGTNGVNLKAQLRVYLGAERVYPANLNDEIFSTAVTQVMPATLDFTRSSNGTFIYCNNPESITNATELADNGPNSSILLHVPNLTPYRNGSNQYTFAASHGNHLSGQDITFDLQFWSGSGATIEITALGVEWPTTQSWASMNAWADYKNQAIYGINSSVNGSSGTLKPFSYQFPLNGSSGAWLSDMVKAGGITWKNNCPNGNPLFLILDFTVISGSVDLNWMAYKQDNRNGISGTDYAPYRWDKQYKGYTTKLPKMQTNLEYYISDALPADSRLPVIVTNSRNPNGVTVNLWNTGINPQSDIYAHYNEHGTVISAESAILPLEYYDGQKWNLYGSAVPDSEKEDTWYFNPLRTDLRQEVVSGYWSDGWRHMTIADTPSPYFKPNAPFNGNLTALNQSVIDDPNYNIGYGSNVTSMSVAANLGNYSVELEYTITFHNAGSAMSVEYHIEGQGDYIINYDGVRRNKGETYGYNPATGKNEDQAHMATFYVPNGTTTVTFSIVLPTADSASLNNYFVLKK